MSIAFTKYVDIRSFDAFSTNVPRREFITRTFTTNAKLSPGSFIDFTSAAQGGDYFGRTSEEYFRCVYYFSVINQYSGFTSPSKISFARYTPVDVAPRIFGTKILLPLSYFQAISDGSITAQIGVDTNLISALDFTLALSFADVAAVIEAGFNAQVGVQWTAATVTYDAVAGAFNFVGGDPVAATISITTGTSGTDIKDAIGWGATAIFTDGALAQGVYDTLVESADASNNFGSIVFMPALGVADALEAATWVDEQNVRFMYLQPVTAANVASYEAALGLVGGTVATLAPLANEYPEMMPGANFAATNYDGANTVLSYMFLQSALTPSVATTAASDAYDLLRVNYYGNTQQAGQQFNFYQRGYVWGTEGDPLDINVYANEIWFKDAQSAAFMELLLNNRVSANDQGISLILAAQQPVLDQALRNGTISVGKALSPAKRAQVTSITGDPNAWVQVQANGYWRNVILVETVVGAVTEYKARVTTVYSKDSTIRKIEGDDFLI